jgi:hypothetical protein
MRAISTRLKRLEQRLAGSAAYPEFLCAAAIVRERRRLRMEAAGLPFMQYIPWGPVVRGPADYPTMAQMVCERRRKRLRLATDNTRYRGGGSPLDMMTGRH